MPPSRLDKALAAAAPDAEGLSRSRLQGLIEAGAVSRDGGQPVTDPSAKADPGSAWVIEVPAGARAEALPEDIPLCVVFEDRHLIVIDKPAGMVVHPAPGSESGTLVNALLHHCGDTLSGIGGVLRPGIVHRIDKGTSGLMVAAKTDAAHQGLARQFADHAVERVYTALCWGAPDASDARLNGLAGVTFEHGGAVRISGNIARHGTDRKRMAVSARSGRHAVTRVRVEESFGPPERPAAALVRCRLETGRTHQIRVHMSHIGHPLVGDPVYGRARPVRKGALSQAQAEALRRFPRQALHAGILGFRHPVSGEMLRFSAELPPDITTLLSILRRY